MFQFLDEKHMHLRLSHRPIPIEISEPTEASALNTPDPSLPLTIIMSAYPAPPPSYNTGKGTKNYNSTDGSTSPLLNSPRAGPSAGGYYDQPVGDVPDDFKVRLLSLEVATSATYTNYSTV